MSQVDTPRSERQAYSEIAANADLDSLEAVGTILKEYTKRRPEVVAMWSFGIGFVLGWKLKMW